MTVKANIIAALCTVGVTGALYVSGSAVKSFADERYLQQSEAKIMAAEAIQREIGRLDDSLFEVGQEIQHANTQIEKAKWQSRKEYYKNKKEAQRDKLKILTSE